MCLLPNHVELLMNVFKATIERTGIDPALVQDITVGNVCAEGGLAVPARYKFSQSIKQDI